MDKLTLDPGRRELLVERDDELAALAQSLSAARDGAGSTVIVEAPAGTGKSSLLTTAGNMAREGRMQVLGARGKELERDFPFGVAIQLFEPHWVATEEGAWADLIAGAPSPAHGLLERRRSGAQHSPDAREYALIHGLFWLTCNLVSPASPGVTGGPLLMLVDDVQWADRSSLRFLNYLAQRVSDLEITLVIAARPGEMSADPNALTALSNAPTTKRLRPDSLSEAGVEALVRARFPEAEQDFVTACARVTNGNPFLLVELLTQVRADGHAPDSRTARRFRGLAPEAIVDSVVARLGTMRPGERALATALSVLGDGASLPHAALLAELDLEEATLAADALATTNMFAAGVPLSFLHPMIRSAVTASISPIALGHAHRCASVILRQEGAAPGVVAAHLLAAPPGGEPDAVETLRAAADIALGRGAAASAVALLARALAERSGPDVDPEVLAELAHAEALAGMPDATKRLTEAMRVTERPDRRAKLALDHGRALYTQARYREAAAVLDDALAEPQLDDELAHELEAVYVCAASLLPDLTDAAAPRRQRLLDGLTDDPKAGEHLALAHIAAHDSVLGEPRPAIRRLADLAWSDGALLEAEADDHLGWQVLTAALLFADELEREVEMCDVALATAGGRESPHLRATATYCRIWPLYEQGLIVKAAADAEAAIDARPDGWRTQFRTDYGAVACCQLQRSQLEKAESALAMIEDPGLRGTMKYPFLLDVRAQLRLAQDRPREALADALGARDHLQADIGTTSPGVIAWRSTAALAHLALGETRHAEELAEEELEEARRIGVTRVVIRDLCVLGLVAGGAAGIELLTEAAGIGEHYPTRLEYINALVELGAALRRANQRAAARESLRKALELSHRGGATALAQRARTELVASGARPRRTMLTGIESLTPSERRVAERAASGLTTRQIANALFVTPKTVEFHLHHVYQKLDVSSRAQLTAALGDEQTG